MYVVISNGNLASINKLVWIQSSDSNGIPLSAFQQKKYTLKFLKCGHQALSEIVPSMPYLFSSTSPLSFNKSDPTIKRPHNFNIETLLHIITPVVQNLSFPLKGFVKLKGKKPISLLSFFHRVAEWCLWRRMNLAPVLCSCLTDTDIAGLPASNAFQFIKVKAHDSEALLQVAS